MRTRDLTRSLVSTAYLGAWSTATIRPALRSERVCECCYLDSFTYTRYGTREVERDAGLLRKHSVILPGQHFVLTALRTIAETELVVATIAAIPVLVSWERSTHHTRMPPVPLADATPVQSIQGKPKG